MGRGTRKCSPTDDHRSAKLVNRGPGGGRCPGGRGRGGRRRRAVNQPEVAAVSVVYTPVLILTQPQ